MFPSHDQIGCYKGRSTAHLLTLLKDKKSEVHIIDTFLGSEEHSEVSNYREEFTSNMSSLGFKENKDYFIHEGLSEDLHERFEDSYFDLIMIDASHDYLNVKKDINNYISKVKENGILAGDDYDFPGVIKAVSELLPNAIITKRKGRCVQDIYAGNNWHIKC